MVVDHGRTGKSSLLSVGLSDFSVAFHSQIEFDLGLVLHRSLVLVAKFAICPVELVTRFVNGTILFFSWTMCND